MIAAHDQASELLTVREAAAYLKVSPVTVKRYLRQGRLRGIHLSSRAVRVRRTDLDRFLTPGKREEEATMPKEPYVRSTPPPDEEIARRRRLLQEILAAREQAAIAPLTTADLVRLAREEAAWYGPND